MLKVREFLFVFLISLIFLGIYQYTRPTDMIGADPYFFINNICHKAPLINQPALNHFIFSAIPCDFLAMKVVLWALLFFSLIFLAMLGKLYTKNGWQASFFVFSSPLLFLEFIKLENDQFAYPLIFLAIFLFFSEKNTNFFKNFSKNQLFASAILLFAGFFIWNGALIVLVALLASKLVGVLVAIIITIPFLQQIYFLGTGSNEHVYENTKFIGFSYLFGLVLGILRIPKEMRIPALILGAVGLFLFKFMFLVVPFLAIGLLLLLNETPKLKLAYIGLTFGMLLVYPLVSFPNFPPSPSHWQAIYSLKENYSTEPYSNEWSYGYWMEFVGLPTEKKGGYSPTTDKNVVVLTYEDLEPRCKPLETFKETKIYRC